ncbi:hypothetical protein KY362_04205 [Candidatus Woesearchaeota archaeon]|nr:hypothetical protein [Candidatus Woesearchaeota archaeon]
MSMTLENRLNENRINRYVERVFHTFKEAEAGKTGFLHNLTQGIRLRYHIIEMGYSTQAYKAILPRVQAALEREKRHAKAAEPQRVRRNRNEQCYMWGDQKKVREARPLEMLVTGDSHKKKRARTIFDDVEHALTSYIHEESQKKGLLARAKRAAGLNRWRTYVNSATQGLTSADRTEAYRLAEEAFPQISRQLRGRKLSETAQVVHSVVDQYRMQKTISGQTSMCRVNLAVDQALHSFMNSESEEGRIGLLDRLTAGYRLRTHLESFSMQPAGQGKSTHLTNTEMATAMSKLKTEWGKRSSEFYNRQNDERRFGRRLGYSLTGATYTCMI